MDLFDSILGFEDAAEEDESQYDHNVFEGDSDTLVVHTGEISDEDGLEQEVSEKLYSRLESEGYSAVLCVTEDGTYRVERQEADYRVETDGDLEHIESAAEMVRDVDRLARGSAP